MRLSCFEGLFNMYLLYYLNVNLGDRDLFPMSLEFPEFPEFRMN